MSRGGYCETPRSHHEPEQLCFSESGAEEAQQGVAHSTARTFMPRAWAPAAKLSTLSRYQVLICPRPSVSRLDQAMSSRTTFDPSCWARSRSCVTSASVL